VVDSLGLANQLQHALVTYTESGGHGSPAIDTAQPRHRHAGRHRGVDQAREATQRGRQAWCGPPPGPEEIAFHDALATNESAVEAMGEAKLRVIAAELVSQAREDVKTDWTLREGAQAKIRVMVKRILNRFGSPPDREDAAVKEVLSQAALLCADWAA